MNRFFVTAVLLAVQAAPAPAQSAITVTWDIKPPYFYLENGEQKGILLERARQVFAVAGVPAQFVREPVKRVWVNFETGRRNYCSIGWYMLPERARVAQFSVAFHTDPAQTVLVAPNAVKEVSAHATLASLLDDRNLTIGIIDGITYGPRVDAMIASSRNHVTRYTTGTVPMMHMLAAGRISYMVMDRDDWIYMKAHDPSLRSIEQRDFRDMPPGLPRYLVCSKDVPAATMARINQAIESVVSSELRNGRSGSQ